MSSCTNQKECGASSAKPEKKEDVKKSVPAAILSPTKPVETKAAAPTKPSETKAAAPAKPEAKKTDAKKEKSN